MLWFNHLLVCLPFRFWQVNRIICYCRPGSNRWPISFVTNNKTVAAREHSGWQSFCKWQCFVVVSISLMKTLKGGKVLKMSRKLLERKLSSHVLCEFHQAETAKRLVTYFWVVLYIYVHAIISFFIWISCTENETFSTAELLSLKETWRPKSVIFPTFFFDNPT